MATCIGRRRSAVANAMPPGPSASLLIALFDEIGQVTLPTVVAVVMHGHEDTWSAKLVRTIPAEAGDLVVRVDLVELEHSQLHLFALVLDLLGFCIGLLLALLPAAGQLKRKEQSRLIRNPTLPQWLR